MLILTDPMEKKKLYIMAGNYFGDMVKAVVDIKQRKIALDAELHADLETILLENGSSQEDLWGINLYPDMDDEDFIEYDSLINIRPGQGNRSRYVENESVRNIIADIVEEWVK